MCDNKRIRVTTYRELKIVKSKCPTFPKGYLESKFPYQTHLIFPPFFLVFFFLPPQQETTDWINYKQQKFVWLWLEGWVMRYFLIATKYLTKGNEEKGGYSSAFLFCDKIS